MKNVIQYQANSVVSCGVEEDGAILYNPDTDETSVINLSGLNLWNFLKTSRSADEIGAHLLLSYSNVSIEQVRKDVDSFINMLIPDFLLEVNNDN